MTNVDYLRQVDVRIRGLNLYNRDSSEYDRMVNVVRPDILSKLSAEEIQTYNTESVMSPAELKRIRAEQLAAMEQNRDSESI